MNHFAFAWDLQPMFGVQWGRCGICSLRDINNQNFLMRDEETGSYWQQINGTAIAGPLKGSKLSLVDQDELTFGLWKEEHPKGTVLAPMSRDAADYEKATWESEIKKLPTVIHAPKGHFPTGRPSLV